MKFAVISDLHFGIKHNSEVFLNSQMSYLLNEFIPALKRENITNIIIAGDLFDSETAINIKVGNEVYEFFDTLRAENIKAVVIIGNHDIYLKSSLEYNSLRFLKEYRNVLLVDTVPVSTSFSSFDTPQTGDILCVPWVLDPAVFLSKLDKYAHKVCIGHFDLSGFCMQKNYPSQAGMLPSLFSRFDLVISGHFHMRSVKDNIVYVGSPYQLTRADEGDERGFMLVDIGEKVSYSFVNSVSPIRFVKVQYPNVYVPSDIKNNVVDVVVKYDDKFDGIGLEEYLKKMESFSPALPLSVQVLSRIGTDVNMEIGKIDFASTKEIMHEYVDKKYTEDKEELKKVLDKLYKESANA